MQNAADNASERLYVIFPAAGYGRRMGGKSGKQFIPVGGIPVLARTLLAFERFLTEQKETCNFTIHGIVVTSLESIHDAEILCDKYNISFIDKFVAGGESRQDSVWNGVCALQSLAVPPEADDVVFIHDGARCFVDSPTLFRCLEGAIKHGVCAAAVPVKDTIKQVESADSARVIATPERSTLYSIQTPQAFLYSLLKKSYEAGHIEKRTATDDTSLAERIGLPVYLVEGAYTNIKITTPEDVLWSEILNTRHTFVSP